MSRFSVVAFVLVSLTACTVRSVTFTVGEDVDAAVDDAVGSDGTAAVCGNGVPEESEACDDGNTTTETACPYGTTTCSPCASDCTSVLSLTGNVCGDRVRDPVAEACDEGPSPGCAGRTGPQLICMANCSGATTVQCGG